MIIDEELGGDRIMTDKKYVKTILMVAVLLMVSILPALANTGNNTDTTTGYFTIRNQPPYRPNITLYYADRTTETTTMTPQTEFAVKIETGDPNGIEDIQNITVYIFYASDVDDESNCTDNPDNPQVHATYKWEKGEGWTFIGPNGTTWRINDTRSEGPVDNTSTSGTWWLHFVPSKVATEANESGMWIIKVVVNDLPGNNNSSKLTGLRMNWYGEINITDTSFDFGTVNYNDTNVPIQDPTDHNIDVKTISNGDHKIQAKTDPVWNHTSENYNVTVNPNGSPGSGEISLKHNGQNDTAGASWVDTANYQDIPNLTGLQQTTEEGITNEIYIWLDVGPSGIIAGTYNGTYYVMVVNA